MSAVLDPPRVGAAPSRPVGAGRREGLAARAALAALLVLGGALYLYAGRRTGFYFDEWDWVQDRRVWSADALLEPHNEHLSLIPVLVYKLLFATVGLESHLPYRLVAIALHLGIVALVFTYARRRVGGWLGLLAAAAVLFVGQGSLDVLWAFQIGFLGSIAAGLGALLCLDRADRRGDIAAAVLLSVALASSSLGIPLGLAAAVEVLGRPDRARRWFVLAVPAVLYGVWYAAYGIGSGASEGNLLAAPAYVADAAAAAAGALAGLGSEWGRPLLLGAVVALALSLRGAVAVPWRLAALVAAPLAFWGLTALARADNGEPGAARYLYPGVLLLVLIGVEASRGVRLSRPGLVLAAVLVAVATLSNLGALRDQAGFLRDRTAIVEGATAATEIAGARLGPEFQPEPREAPQLRAGRYRDAAREHGSPAPGAAELRAAAAPTRLAADATLVRGYELGLVSGRSAVAGGPAPAPDPGESASPTARGSCLLVAPQGADPGIRVTVPAGGLLVDPGRGGATVAVRRWADAFSPLGAGTATAAPMLLRIPADSGAVPWRAEIRIDGPTRLCGVSG